MVSAIAFCFFLLTLWSWSSTNTVCRCSPIRDFDPNENWFDLVGPKIHKSRNSLSTTQTPGTNTKQPVTDAANGVMGKSLNANTLTVEQKSLAEMDQGQKQCQEQALNSCILFPVNDSTEAQQKAKLIENIISKPLAIIFGAEGQEPIVYSPNEEDFPGCMEIKNITIMSVNHFNTCIRLFSSTTCSMDSTSYYPGKIVLDAGEVLKSARSIGKCLRRELDDTTSKYVQRGMDLMIELTKIELIPGSRQYAVPDNVIFD